MNKKWLAESQEHIRSGERESISRESFSSSVCVRTVVAFAFAPSLSYTLSRARIRRNSVNDERHGSFSSIRGRVREKKKRRLDLGWERVSFPDLFFYPAKELAGLIWQLSFSWLYRVTFSCLKKKTKKERERSQDHFRCGMYNHSSATRESPRVYRHHPTVLSLSLFSLLRDLRVLSDLRCFTV